MLLERGSKAVMLRIATWVERMLSSPPVAGAAVHAVKEHVEPQSMDSGGHAGAGAGAGATAGAAAAAAAAAVAAVPGPDEPPVDFTSVAKLLMVARRVQEKSKMAKMMGGAL